MFEKKIRIVYLCVFVVIDELFELALINPRRILRNAAVFLHFNGDDMFDMGRQWQDIQFVIHQDAMWIGSQ